MKCFLFEFKLMYQSTVDEEHLPTSRGWVRNSPTKKAENWTRSYPEVTDHSTKTDRPLYWSYLKGTSRKAGAIRPTNCNNHWLEKKSLKSRAKENGAKLKKKVCWRPIIGGPIGYKFIENISNVVETKVLQSSTKMSHLIDANIFKKTSGIFQLL